MSRGPGRIERAILDEMRRRPNAAFSTAELCTAAAYYALHHYNEFGRILRPHVTKSERVAVLRAARRLVERARTDPTMLYVRSCRRGGEVMLFNAASVESYSRASGNSMDSQWLKFDMQYFDAERRGDAEQVANVRAKKAAAHDAYMAMVIRR